MPALLTSPPPPARIRVRSTPAPRPPYWSTAADPDEPERPPEEAPPPPAPEDDEPVRDGDDPTRGGGGPMGESHEPAPMGGEPAPALAWAADLAPPGGEPPEAQYRRTVEAWSMAHRFVDLCLEVFNGYRPVVHIRAVSAPANAPQILQEVTSATRRVGRRHFAAEPPTARPAAGPPRGQHPGNPQPQGKGRGTGKGHRPGKAQGSGKAHGSGKAQLPHRKVRRVRLRVSEPSTDVAEAVAILADASGTWALAFRLERRSGTWLCSALTAVC